MKTGSKLSEIHIGRYLLSGIIMSACTVIIWFLLSTSARKTGALIFAALVILAVLDLLCFLPLKKQKRSHILACCIIALLNMAIMLSVTIYAVASAELFYPHFDEQSYKSLQTQSSAEELVITSGNRTLSGWMLHNAEGKAPLLLYFGGNGENSSKRILTIINSGLQSAFAGYNVAFLDYPGYGKSSGNPSQESLQNMGLEAYDTLEKRSDVDPNRIVLFGYSIGTGVANYVSSERNVEGLILMAPYASGYDLYNSELNIFHGPLRLLVGFKMESEQFAKNISVKPLVLASKSDKTVSYESSVRLSEVYPNGCSIKTFDDLGHNDFWGSEGVLKCISEFLHEVNENEK